MTLRCTILFYLIFSGIACFFISGCAVNPVTGQQELMFVSEKEELVLGNKLFPNAIWSGEGGGGEYKDPALKSYLGSLVMNIHRASHRPNLPLDFSVQNSSLPNAWAIPGHVVITRGLLAGLDNEAEFTYIMGHEIGHVSARHSAKQLTHGMMGQFLLGGVGVALAGSGYSDAAMSLGSVGAGVILAKFSRSDELDADRLGVTYMTRLGYDPGYALTAHRNLEKISGQYARSIGQDKQESGFFNDLLASHPRTSIRVEEIQKMIDETPPGPVSGDGSGGQRFLSSMAGMRRVNDVYVNYYDKAARAFKKNNPREAIAYLDQAIARDPNQAPFYALYGNILYKQNRIPEAERYYAKALSLDGDYQPALRGLGAITFLAGNYPESVRYVHRSLQLFPQDPPSNYMMGMIYYRTRQYKSAIGYLKPLSESVPDHPRIHAILGQCYEATGQYQAAYAEYVMQLKVAPDSEAGNVAKTRANAIRLKYGK